MKCWKCGAPQEDVKARKLHFRELCDACSSWQHCCKNCIHYKPGLSNDCDVPDKEFVPDREKYNFCEEFKALGQGPTKKANQEDIEHRLFGNQNPKPPSEKGFDSLFHDDTW